MCALALLGYADKILAILNLFLNFIKQILTDIFFKIKGIPPFWLPVLFVVTQSGSPLACRWISLGAWQTSGLAGGYLCQDFLFHANKFQNDPQLAADGFEVRFWLHNQISGWNWKTALKILTVDDSILFIHTELRTELLMNINKQSPHTCTVCATDSSANVLFKVFLPNELFCKDCTFSAPPVHLKMIHTQNT